MHFENVKDWKLGFVPSLITVLALTLGVHAMKFLFAHQVEKAVFCIFVAAILDGFDGKIARYLKVSSKFGGTLDTLADFLNFGIVPALTMYVKYFGIAGAQIYWLSVVIYITCSALRLARFSVIGMSGDIFFKGVPAPGAAFLVMFPICLGHAFGEYLNNIFLAYLSMALLVFVAGLMLSSFRTISLSRIRISKDHFPKLIIGLCACFTMLYLYTCLFIIVLQVLYFSSIFIRTKQK